MGDEIRKKLLLFGVVLLMTISLAYASEAPTEGAHAAAEHYPYVFTGVETLFAVIGCFYFALFVNVFSKFMGKEVE